MRNKWGELISIDKTNLKYFLVEINQLNANSACVRTLAGASMSEWHFHRPQMSGILFAFRPFTHYVFYLLSSVTWHFIC